MPFWGSRAAKPAGESSPFRAGSGQRGEYNVEELTIAGLGKVIEDYYSSIESIVECYGEGGSGAGWKQVVAEIMSEKQAVSDPQRG